MTSAQCQDSDQELGSSARPAPSENSDIWTSALARHAPQDWGHKNTDSVSNGCDFIDCFKF